PGGLAVPRRREGRRSRKPAVPETPGTTPHSQPRDGSAVVGVHRRESLARRVRGIPGRLDARTVRGPFPHRDGSAESPESRGGAPSFSELSGLGGVYVRRLRPGSDLPGAADERPALAADDPRQGITARRTGRVSCRVEALTRQLTRPVRPAPSASAASSP